MYQKIQLIGNVGEEPTMRFTDQGQAVTSFSLATSNSYKDKNEEWHTRTTWWRVTLWGSRAETAKERVQKGSRLYVEGTIVVDKQTGHPKVYEKKDGTWDSNLEIKADLIRYLDKKNKDSDSTPYDAESEEE